ncbi:MAG: AAA family ATPase [Umezawaea sp.]
MLDRPGEPRAGATRVTGNLLIKAFGEVMHISRVRLRNIKGFHGAREVDIELRAPGWTVIAGRNGSGKTTLLRAIALAITGPTVANTLVSDFENWISAGSRTADAEVLLTHDDTADRLADSLFSHEPLQAVLRWTAPHDTTPFNGVQPELASVDHNASMSDGPWDRNPNGWFCAAYGPFRRLAGGAGDVQRLMVRPGPVARLATLFQEDASLAEGVSWLIRQHLRALEGQEGAEELKRTALALLGDGLLPDHYRIDHVDSEGLWIVVGEHRFPLREMSDGYRTVVALVVDLLKQIHQTYGSLKTDGLAVLAPGVVIIDEVDAHLHVSWQKRIGGWLKEHFPDIQFIVTTHSPYVCQAADPGGLIRLPGPTEDEPPRVVDQDLYERIVYGSGDDAILSELFGLDSPYSEEAERLRAELVDLEVAVISGTATAQAISRYDELKNVLTSSPVARSREVQTRLGLPEE